MMSCRNTPLLFAPKPSTTDVSSGLLAPPTPMALVHEVLQSPGAPLQANTRSFMAQRFGHDFSRVRVHRDAKAAESARSVRSFAYTVGSNIVFGEGRYAPDTRKGKSLLAHELTHVVQQGGEPTGSLQR